jgi:hypothetical protein
VNEVEVCTHRRIPFPAEAATSATSITSLRSAYVSHLPRAFIFVSQPSRCSASWRSPSRNLFQLGTGQA